MSARKATRFFAFPKVRAAVAVPGLVVLAAVMTGLLTTAASGSAPATTDTPVSSVTANAVGGSTTRSDPITYSTPHSPSEIASGSILYSQHCASCHAANPGDGDALGGLGPNLEGIGAGTIDFWVSTGRMPLEVAANQASRKPSPLTAQQTNDIVAYVSSLDPQPTTNLLDPAIPTVETSRGNVAAGFDQFVLNCAACHTISGSGDALANGADAPSLHVATPTEVAEAIRSGPGNMPRYGPGEFTDQQVADIVAFVTDKSSSIQHPDDAGGLGLGGLGPVAEGFVALLIGVGFLMLICFWLGERS